MGLPAPRCGSVNFPGDSLTQIQALKNMLIERLQQMPLPDRKTHLIEFDAWMYSRSGEIVSALFSEISAGLSPRLKWYQKLLMRFDCFNNNAITSVVHLIYRAINAVLPYSEIGISIGCISWSFQNLSKLLSETNLKYLDVKSRIHSFQFKNFEDQFF